MLPTGEVDPPRYADLSALRYRDFSRVQERIEQEMEDNPVLDQIEPTGEEEEGAFEETAIKEPGPDALEETRSNIVAVVITCVGAWLLHTTNAHGLYRRFGFEPRSERLMERQ